MPIRFSTEAANADVMGEDAEGRGTPAGKPQSARDDWARSGRFERPARPRGPAGNAPAPEVKPGKDINAPGFIKDKDASKP